MADPDLATVLDAAADALGVALDVGQRMRLARYAELVVKWRRVANLTGAPDAATFCRAHIVDALAVVPHTGRGRLLDVGSGAGVPGVVLAIAVPGLDVTLLESRGRRARFLTQVGIELELPNLTVAAERLERFRPGHPFETIIARAFAPLPDLLAALLRARVTAPRVLVMQAAVAARDLDRCRAEGMRAEVVPLAVPGFAERNLVVVATGRPPDAGEGGGVVP